MNLSVLIPVFAAIFGYAVGTLQILFVDWVRSHRKHARHLRALRSELERALSFNETFNWTEQGPKEDYLPDPPSVSPRYIDLVTETDWRLTDAYDNDNTQHAFLAIADGCRHLQHYERDIRARLDQLKGEGNPAHYEQLKEELVILTKEYDSTLEVLEFTARDALSEIKRRLDEIGILRQLRRPRKLPIGEIPDAIRIGDKRLDKLRSAPPPDRDA